MIDAWLQKLPGRHGIKVLVGTVALLGATAYPVFRNSESKQGHDYFSQEKPEAVTAGQDHLRKEYRLAKKAERAKQQHRGEKEKENHAEE